MKVQRRRHLAANEREAEINGQIIARLRNRTCIRNFEEILSRRDTIDAFVEICFSFKIVFAVMYMEGEGDARLVMNFIFLLAGSLAEKTFNVNYIFDLMPWIYRFFLRKINNIVSNLLYLFRYIHS